MISWMQLFDNKGFLIQKSAKLILEHLDFTAPGPRDALVMQLI